MEIKDDFIKRINSQKFKRPVSEIENEINYTQVILVALVTSLILMFLILSYWTSRELLKLQTQIIDIQKTEFKTVEIILPVQVVIAEKPLEEKEKLSVPDIDSSFKTFMDYRTITDRASVQYELQQYSETDLKGFRKFNGRYMVALGTAYAQYIGQEFQIEFDCGTVIDAVVGDFKANQHTDSTNRFIEMNGNIIEFIVDTNVLDRQTQQVGNVSNLIAKGTVKNIFRFN